MSVNTTTRVWPVVGVSMAVLWVFVRGPEPAPSAVLGQLLVGSVVGLPLAFVFRRLYPDRIDVARGISVFPSVVAYLALFAREVIVANVDVAYRALAPGTRLEPEVILVPLRVESALGVTTIANSITITPGTVTLDHDPAANAIYVHIIDGRNPEAVVTPIRRWEDYALEIFDEPRDPSDRAPTVVVDPKRGIVVEDRRRGRADAERVALGMEWIDRGDTDTDTDASETGRIEGTGADRENRNERRDRNERNNGAGRTDAEEGERR